MKSRPISTAMKILVVMLVFLFLTDRTSVSASLERLDFRPISGRDPVLVQVPDPWQLYQNLKYNFAIQYPASWTLLDFSPEYVRFFEKPNTVNGSGPLSYISVLVLGNPMQLTLDQWLLAHGQDVKTMQPLLLGSDRAMVWTEAGNPTGGSRTAYLQQADIVYQISLIVMEPDRKDLVQMYDSMLSSFRFSPVSAGVFRPSEPTSKPQQGPSTVTVNYDRQAAYNYAQSYYWRPVDDRIYYYCTVSPDGNSYSNCSSHNDCVHFVSHVMNAGGVNDGHLVNTTDLANWFNSSGNGTFVSSQTALSPGDVIFYSWDGGPIWDHSAAVIANNGGGDVRIAEHSFLWNSTWDQWNVPWDNYGYHYNGYQASYGFVAVAGGGGGGAPSAPSNPNPSDNAMIGRTTDINLSWSTNGTSCDVHIWGGPGLNTTQTNVSCSSFHLGSQWPGAYQWQVTAKNGSGSTAGPTWHFNVRPYSPTNLSASPASQTQINLNWTKSNDDPGSVDSYKIYFSNGTFIATVNSGTTNYIVGNLSCGNSYSFYVTAVRQGVESDPSNTASANTNSCGSPPGTPSSPNPGDGATIERTSDTTFYWSTNGTSCDIHIWGGPGIDTTQNGVSCSSFHWGNQWPGSYQWQVTAHNSYGTTGGPAWHLNIKPYAPTNLSASGTSQTQINLSWTKSSDDPGSVDNYKVYYSNGTYITTLNSGTTNYIVGNLTCGQSYSFYVTSIRQGVESNASNSTTASTQSCGSPPSAPTNPSPSDGAILDRTSDISLYWNTNGTSCDVHIWGGPSINSTLTGVSCSSFHWGVQWPGSYQWQVTAHSAYGTTGGPAWGLNIKPYSPTSLTATPGSQTQINLSWTKSSDDPGSVDNYKVYYNNGSYITTLSSGSTSYGVTGLTCGTSYSFYVTAIRQGIESTPSNTSSGSTASCPVNVTVTSVWTTDGSGNAKSSFNPGDSIRYYGDIYNTSSTPQTAWVSWSVNGPCGSIASWSGDLSISSGHAWWWLPSSIPTYACGGAYTYQMGVTFNGSTTSQSTTFTVSSITDPRQEGPVTITGLLEVGGRAYFTINIKNYGNAPTPAIHPYIEGYANGTSFWRADGAQPGSAVIQPGQTVSFQDYQDLWWAGTWAANGIYLWNNDAKTYWKALPANGQNQQFSFIVTNPPKRLFLPFIKK